MHALNGKNAIITGASKGVGRAIALKLAQESANVALLARSKDKLDATTEQITSKDGIASSVVCDLSQPEEVTSAISSCRRIFNDKVDILINNAGVFLEKPTSEIELDEWEKTFNINLKAPFLMCREILPLMQQQKSGHIINIASTSALKGHYNQAAYCASKHGLLGFSRALAQEANPDKVRVNCISPGGINTEFISGSHVAERIQNQSVLEPDNVADLVLFILKQPPNTDFPEITMERFKYS